MSELEFLKIISPFKDRVFRLSKRLLISEDEARDASQEIFIKLWQLKKKLHKYNNIEALSITLTKNYCYDILKSKRSANLKITHNNYTDHSISLQNTLEVRNSYDLVQDLISKLPKKQRIILQLREVEGYSYAEIAEVLQINQTAIRVSLSRARKQLRKELKKLHDYGLE
jgi:RNA polymerase sigma-70 factor (ECF subfamily)